MSTEPTTTTILLPAEYAAVFEEFADSARNALECARETLALFAAYAERAEREAADREAQLTAERAARLEAEERERQERDARERAEAAASPKVVAGASIVEDDMPEIAGDGSGEVLREIGNVAGPRFSMQLHPGTETTPPVILMHPLDQANGVFRTSPLRVVAPLFDTVSGLCSHVLDVLEDDGPDAAKVRLCSLLLRANGALLGVENRVMTGGGGGVDERNAAISEDGGR